MQNWAWEAAACWSRWPGPLSWAARVPRRAVPLRPRSVRPVPQPWSTCRSRAPRPDRTGTRAMPLSPRLSPSVRLRRSHHSPRAGSALTMPSVRPDGKATPAHNFVEHRVRRFAPHPGLLPPPRTVLTPCVRARVRGGWMVVVVVVCGGCGGGPQLVAPAFCDYCDSLIWGLVADACRCDGEPRHGRGATPAPLAQL